MFEAVGKNWNNYFKILNRSLKIAALQIITVNENLYSNMREIRILYKGSIPPGNMYLCIKSLFLS